MGWLGRKNKADADNPWRQRYYTELEQLENELAQARRVEDALRRLGSRLCVAGKGQSPMLDACLDESRHALRKPLPCDKVEQLVSQLSRTLEHSPTPAAPSPSPPASENTPSAGQILVQIIDGLNLQGDIREQAGPLRARLCRADSAHNMQASIDELTQLLARQNRHASERAQHYQALLTRVTQRLDEVTDHLAFDELSRQQQAHNSDAFKQHLSGEMSALNQLSREATDLNSLQHEVDEKIARVDRHLSRFRERERELAAAYRERSDKLKHRINQLEDQALTLESQITRQRQKALIDTLTGIPNREAWAQAALEYFQQYRDSGRALALAIWDIDHFKVINDTHGHQAGDRALQMVAQHLHQGLDEPAFTARVGGEEFASFLPGYTARLAQTALEKLRRGIQNLAFRHQDKMLKLTVSCGITEILPHDTLDSAYARADTALYEAKRAGRNRITLHPTD